MRFLIFLLFSCVTISAQSPSAPIAAAKSELRLPGIQQPVEVLRDRWGVSHIYAKNQHDLFFEQGYVAATDRLFQMELWKRTGQGRLAEALGPSAVQRDINARLLRYRGPMAAEYESYAPDAQPILEAFTSGINAYIDGQAGKFGVEFQVAGFAPEHWRPEDCLSRNAAYSMTADSENELYIAKLISSLGPEKAARLLPLDPPVKLESFTGADYSGLTPELIANIVSSDKRIEFPPKESNNWTVSGALTATGRPMLANDPHRTISLPSLRYIVHLVAPGWDVIGAGEPALPGVAIGHNQKVAWGLTIFEIDQKDFFLEKLDPADPHRYRTPRGWKRMEVVRETVHVKGAPDVQAELCFTQHGPVLWFDPKSHRALALRWVGAEPGSAGYLASLSLDRAQNWQEFRSALLRWKLPPENFVYADTSGNIGEQSAGYAPIRTPLWSGMVPAPGDGDLQWNGWRSLDELPHSFNPARGFVATANHKTIAEDDPHPVGFLWDPGFRFRRISDFFESLQKAGKKLRMADMRALQSDVLSLPALAWQDLLRPAVKRKPALHDDRSVTGFLGWDGRLEAGSTVASLYELWERHLDAAAVERNAPLALRPMVRENWSPQQTLNFFKQLPAEERDDLLLKTMRLAEADLTHKDNGGNEKGWGALHTVRFRHPLDQSPAAHNWTLGPFARPGDEYTVNSTGGTGFAQDSGASYREIFDVGAWDDSLAVNTPGQSALSGSPHYADLLPLWLAGDYFPLLYSRSAVEKDAEDVATYHP